VSEAAQTELVPAPPGAARNGRPSLWQIVILASVVCWLYGPTLYSLVVQWWHDPDFSHGFFVPVFSFFVLWRDRSRFARLKPNPSWGGLVVLIFGVLTFITGQLGAELFLPRFSLILVIAGLTVLFLGWNFLRAAAFPLAFLVLMIPIPAIVFNQITFPLQLLASRLAAAVLDLCGVPVLREGNLIILPCITLEVAKACSGIRSLISLITLAIIYGYLAEKRLWIRCLLALASVPIAVIANSFRVIGTGLLLQWFNFDTTRDKLHKTWGWIIFVISLLLLYVIHKAVLLLSHEKGRTS
jgi:exosortase